MVAEFLLAQTGQILESATPVPVLQHYPDAELMLSRLVIFTVSCFYFVEFKQSVYSSAIFVSFKFDISDLYFFVL